ncbi:YkgJ family cysteine cluster protein [Meiothermus ruber]|jgi:hypothetical protein|uniref:YkgJ family cysteine cluster protein n=1 Tax=Meiothermus ruber (strain ATCC 35948 / DSM 1279 / VKM B-1258 / 21) TaxID=504728 RepID=D3PQN4_MEIRD|nr:YkgJ family cysteine cluster protein [Meiothermus ruber]ADD27767.1 protein of unknown function UPF0153 [Meiothermus ruber DSM 1279]AGK04232.1 hypothetical protein K649_04650 [Meiothermus ruber DSM 1279]MCL6530705.1 YkgJ family cysteine cluster protein [Meiothermus ruber]MCX7802443.1 YkgJ family cysteine cluster protein [Meiothermus ruber]GAO74695.1 putative uncharacterized protein [Meiothermus ruber H328]
MSPELRRAVSKAHEQLERRTAAYLAERGVRVSCGPGCKACCSAWVVVGLAEAEYLREALEAHQPEALARIEAEGRKRLARIARQKHLSDFPTRYFLENRPCPLLTPEGFCSTHPHRPLACRGLLTNLSARYCVPGVVPALRGREKTAYRAQLRPWHGPEHYLKVPWLLSERTAQKLWAAEQHKRGFVVIGELIGLVFLLGQHDFQEALRGGLETVRQTLEKRRLLGGAYGFWVG